MGVNEAVIGNMTKPPGHGRRRDPYWQLEQQQTSQDSGIVCYGHKIVQRLFTELNTEVFLKRPI